MIYQRIFVGFQKTTMFSTVMDVIVGLQLIVTENINVLTIYNCFLHCKAQHARYGPPCAPPLLLPYENMHNPAKTYISLRNQSESLYIVQVDPKPESSCNPAGIHGRIFFPVRNFPKYE